MHKETVMCKGQKTSAASLLNLFRCPLSQVMTATPTMGKGTVVRKGRNYTGVCMSFAVFYIIVIM